MKLPPDLRISQPEFPDPVDMEKDLAKSLSGKSKNERMENSSTKPPRVPPETSTKEALSIIINIWRIKSRMTDVLSKEPKEELAKEDVKKIARYVESIYDCFARLGIEIIDRTGESFDYGLPEKVVTAKPQDGISKELVLETLRPTIKWNHHLYPGEVEIATPLQKNDKGEL